MEEPLCYGCALIHCGVTRARYVIVAMQENEVYVPNWANHMGMNDRFALLHPQSAGLWKGRLDHTLKHCVEEPIHSETFVRHFALSNHLQVQPRVPWAAAPPPHPISCSSGMT